MMKLDLNDVIQYLRKKEAKAAKAEHAAMTHADRLRFEGQYEAFSILVSHFRDLQDEVADET